MLIVILLTIQLMSVKSIIKFYLDNTKGYRGLCVLLLFNSFLMSWEAFVFGKAKEWLLNIITSDSSLTISNFTYPLVLLTVGLCFIELLHFNKQLLERFAFPYINKNLFIAIYAKIQSMPYMFFQNNSVGTIISKLRCICRNYEYLFFDVTDVVALNNFKIIINITALFAVHKMLGIIMLTYCIVFIAVTTPFLMNVNKCVVVENNIFHVIIGTIADKLTNIRTIITNHYFRHEKTLLDQDISNNYIPAKIKTYRQELNFLGYGGVCYVIMMVFIVYYTISLKLSKTINVGDIALIITLITSTSNAIWSLMENVSYIVDEIGELQSAFSIFDGSKGINIDSSVQNTNDSSEGKYFHKIPVLEFRHVTFNYSSNNVVYPVFKDFNLMIHPGERIGIIGVSGAGKTSIFSLLLKYFPCYSGEILIDGVNVNDIPTEELMNNVSVIPQNITLFQRSIMDNLRYGHEDFQEEKVYELCKKVKLHDVIMNLPEGYNTVIGESGGNISGGQKQRIAIVRAFIKRAKIILLDEATSALDLITEQAITDLLELLYQETHPTVITISHKLHTVKNMDRIIVLEDGNIIEQGSHNSLIANNDSLYAKLWKIQQA